MNIIWAIIMGIVQGLTEFFPVSSSAHLTLFPWIFGYNDPGLAFDIALHAGTLVAIVIALWPDWQKLFVGVLKKDRQSLTMILFLLITSIPGAIFGIILEDQVKTVFRGPLLVAANLVVFGIILWAIDQNFSEKKIQKEMKWPQAALIGVSQALAIVPGVSRSGATITCGRLLSFTREAAVRYSFMAALPIIAGATLWGLRDVPVDTLLSASWVFGFLASLLASVWAIKFLLKYVKNHNFNLFVWWRFGLAALVIILYLVRIGG